MTSPDHTNSRLPIEGVVIRPLQRVPDERGTILHILSSADPWFDRFGEIYASSIYEGAIKGWHRHQEMTLNYACLSGRVKCVLFDDRADSTTLGSIMEVFLGPDNYALLTIPPGVWNGFKGMTDAIVVNCSTHAHDPARSERRPPNDPFFPYDWVRRDH